MRAVPAVRSPSRPVAHVLSQDYSWMMRKPDVGGTPIRVVEIFPVSSILENDGGRVRANNRDVVFHPLRLEQPHSIRQLCSLRITPG